MDVRLKPLVMWPERENLRKIMPECFRAEFGENVVVVIDCFEVFIERPSNLLARASTWSAYKHHNTVKLLIGITPQGVVSFISEAWGGSSILLFFMLGEVKSISFTGRYGIHF